MSTNVLGSLINICKPKSINEFSFEQLFENLSSHFMVKKVDIAERVFFSICQQNDNLVGFATILRLTVVDEFYQQALITAFVMKINDCNVKATLMKKDLNTFSDVVE